MNGLQLYNMNCIKEYFEKKMRNYKINITSCTDNSNINNTLEMKKYIDYCEDIIKTCYKSSGENTFDLNFKADFTLAGLTKSELNEFIQSLDDTTNLKININNLSFNSI